jgi:nitroreductase
MTDGDVDAHLARIASVRGVPAEALAALRGMLVGGIVAAKDQPAQQAWAARQTYLALGNLLTSAALLGIDACPMEGFDPAQYDTILGLEAKGLASTVICTLGYRAATDGYAGLAKVRFPKADLITHL